MTFVGQPMKLSTRCETSRQALAAVSVRAIYPRELRPRDHGDARCARGFAVAMPAGADHEARSLRSRETEGVALTYVVRPDETTGC
jgi:hypothetical protein